MSIKPVALANKVRPEKVVEALKTLQSPNKLPASAIENAVLSVNGQIGHVQIGQTETVAQVNSDWNSTSGPSQILNKPEIPEIDYPVKSVNGKSGDVNLGMEDINGLTEVMSEKMDIDSVISVSQIQGMPDIPDPQVQTDWLATSGMAEILNKPNLFSGSYEDLTEKPDLFDGNYSSLTGKPQLFSGRYSDLEGKPALSSVAETGSYSDLKNLPTLFDGKWISLTGKPNFSNVATSGSYNDLTDKPTIPPAQVNADWTATSGVSYILNKPSLFDGNYNSLTNKPTLFDGTWVSLKDKPTFAAVATSGNYVDLTNKPTLFSGSYSDLTNKPTLFSGAYADLTGKPTIPNNTNQLTNGAGFVTSTQAAAAAPVQSVNGKTGAVNLSASDVGAALAAQGTKYYRQANTQVTGLKVKYYQVTSDSSGAWSLNLGTDFTEVLDVQAQAVSSTGVTGIRQSTVNTFSSNSTTITGMTWGNTVLVTILLSGTNSLSLTPNTVVRVRVEGVGT